MRKIGKAFRSAAAMKTAASALSYFLRASLHLTKRAMAASAKERPDKIIAIRGCRQRKFDANREYSQLQSGQARLAEEMIDNAK
jgi:hypothetical protein